MNKIKYLFLISILFLIGCTAFFAYREHMKGETMKESFTGTLEIYKINRETFYSFLEHPSIELFNVDSDNIYSYTEKENWYITYNITRFPIQQSLIDFAGDVKQVEQYLVENGITANIERIIVFEAPYIPITIWIKSDIEDICITINEQLEDKDYVYRIYSFYEYYEKYCCRDASFMVDGQYITTNIPVKMYYGYADIPLTVTLEALGAQIVKEDNMSISIIIKEKKYYLNIKNALLYEDNIADVNLLYQIDGGPIFVYKNNQEIMVDSNTLSSVLYQMGVFVTIKCDAENEKVIIEQASNEQNQ